ncbi:MAG: Gfo/Idh/MocA family oxidoreductase [Spirochaetaceae bacterium]|jgi:predicted dehydrogenase|nr:Gfo/Idh/MocA family oxidoreductase [Spirochaetaceae bacterium]
MDKVKAAIIGLGRIASLLEDDALREKPCTHAGALSANPDCILTAGMDTDGKRRDLFAKRWNVEVYRDAQLMLREQLPQILVVATDPDSHAEYCCTAAHAGVPLVICEKPLADTVKDARNIASLTKPGKFRVLVNHERRYSENYRRAKAIIDEKRLGELLSVRALLYFGKNRRLIDVLWHDGTHLVDAIAFLSGAEIRHQAAWGADLSDKAGTAWLLGTLAGSGKAGSKTREIPCVIEAGAGRDHLVFEIEFSFSGGRLRIGNGVYEVWESAPSPYAENFCSLEKTGETFTGKTGFFANMVADAVSCIKNPSLRPCSSAQDGLAVIEYLNSVKALRN